jgi:cysteine-rich repeat protein
VVSHTFGAALAASDATILVGRPAFTTAGGPAYLFDADTGALVKSIRSPNPTGYCDEVQCIGDRYGAAVAFHGDEPVVAAPQGSWGASELGGVVFRFLPPCGDGVLDPGEECDDHNTTAGDGGVCDRAGTCGPPP